MKNLFGRPEYLGALLRGFLLSSRIIVIIVGITGFISCSMFNPLITYFTEISLSSDSVYLSVGETQVIEIGASPVDAGEDLTFTSSVKGVVDYLGDNQSLLITGKTTGMSVIDIKGKNTSRKLVVNVTPSSSSDGSIYLATPSTTFMSLRQSVLSPHLYCLYFYLFILRN